MTDEETRIGAESRAQGARENYADGDFWVGIEGGIERIDKNFHAFAWMIILNKSRKGFARTATFALPPEISKLVNQGIELGVADDASGYQMYGGSMTWDNSWNRRTSFKASMTNQFHPAHEFKAGLEYNYNTLREDRLHWQHSMLDPCQRRSIPFEGV